MSVFQHCSKFVFTADPGEISCLQNSHRWTQCTSCSGESSLWNSSSTGLKWCLRSHWGLQLWVFQCLQTLCHANVSSAEETKKSHMVRDRVNTVDASVWAIWLLAKHSGPPLLDEGGRCPYVKGNGLCSSTLSNLSWFSEFDSLHAQVLQIWSGWWLCSGRKLPQPDPSSQKKEQPWVLLHSWVSWEFGYGSLGLSSTPCWLALIVDQWRRTTPHL